MKLIIFNCPFHENYNGIEIKNNSLNVYDKFYQEKKGNNPEIYNFQDYNGYCYGYVSIKEGKVDLNALNFINDSSPLFFNCIVAWVNKDVVKNKYILIGWYKNSIVYRFLQRKLSYPSVGRDLYFNIKAKSKNCFLLHQENRSLYLDIPFKNQTNFYIPHENSDIYKNILYFINNYNGKFKNIILNEITLNSTIENPPNNPLLLSKRGSIYLYSEGNFIEALKYFNSALLLKDNLSEDQIINIRYQKAICLQFLNVFEGSIKEFESILPKLGYDLNIIKNLIYLYMSIENYDKSIEYCNKIIQKEENYDINMQILDELKCLKVECFIFINEINLAKKLINEIINTTKLDSILIHCKKLLSRIN